MSLVQRLSDTLVNQIAAGEVVERPASVAKELCENALDAGARNISVEIVEGGTRRLVVADDGCGMAPEDARTCLERHATSKLRTEDGLKNIGTLGFRGEAIPAIASVSRFTLTTCPNPAARRVPTSWETGLGGVFSGGDGSAERLAASDVGTAGEGVGTRITSEGGESVEVEAVGAAPGTRVEVCDLFFNTPARRKFLKRPVSEATNLIEAISRLALARPEVGFRLVSNGRQVFASPAAKDLSDTRERMAVALGVEAVKHLLPVRLSRGDVAVHGYITDPDYTLSTSKGIYTYVNGRYVRDRSLVSVIQRSYRDVTEPGRNPACVLFIDLPLAEVDINVHPQKLEVRFADAQGVTGCVFRAVQEALRNSPWLQGNLGDVAARNDGSLEGRPDVGDGAAPSTLGEPGSAYGSNGGMDGLGTFGNPGNGPSPMTPESIWGRDRLAGIGAPTLPRHGYEDIPLKFAPRPGVAGMDSGLSAPAGAEAAATSAGGTDGTAAESATSEGFFHSLRIIGQFAATYIVCEAPGQKLLVIDQHAAHERVRFHALREAFRRRAPSVQPFLVPMTLEFTPAEASVLAENAEALERIGFQVEPFGGGSIALKAVPSQLVGCDHRKMLLDLAGELATVGRAKAFDEAMDHALATMACHSAIRAHEIRTETELRALLDALDGIDFSTRCPHGRPIAASVTIPELEREVARR